MHACGSLLVPWHDGRAYNLRQNSVCVPLRFDKDSATHDDKVSLRSDSKTSTWWKLEGFMLKCKKELEPRRSTHMAHNKNGATMQSKTVGWSVVMTSNEPPSPRRGPGCVYPMVTNIVESHHGKDKPRSQAFGAGPLSTGWKVSRSERFSLRLSSLSPRFVGRLACS
jgi:hypothetical protein